MAAQIDTEIRAVSVISPKRDEVSTPAEQNAFVVSAETTYDEIALQLVSDLNDFGDEANILSTEVSANATSAEQDALIAQSVVNSKGAWSGLTGALNIPASVTHTGSVWVLNVNIADVTLSEPTDVNTDWTEVSGVTQAELDLKEDITANDAKLALKASLSGANFTGRVGLKKSADVASATVLPIPVNGNFANVTGTTTVTSIATTGNIGTKIEYEFKGILTLTHHATDLFLPSKDDIITAVGDVAEFIEYATGDFKCTKYTKSDGTSVVGTGKVLQELYDEYTTYSSSATIIPLDDTIPQNTEGTEWLSVTITPKSATSILRIQALVNQCPGTGSWNIMALFRDSGANALRATQIYSSTNEPLQVTLLAEIASGSTAETTLKIRTGNSVGICFINGNTSARQFGGSAVCTLTITEVEV